MVMKKSCIWFLMVVLSMTTVNLLQAKEMEFENAKIFTVFLGEGYMAKKPENLLTNEQVLNKLKNECLGVDFIVWNLTRGESRTISNAKTQEVLNDLKRGKEDLDGVLIIGNLNPYELAFTGLPTIVVYNLFEFMWEPYKHFHTGKAEDLVRVGGPDYKGGRVLTATLDRRNQCKPSVSKAMFDDLVYKVNLIRALSKLKQTRVLVVTPRKFLSEVDYSIGDCTRDFPEDHNENYIRALKETFGIELVIREPEEFVETFNNVNHKKAEEIADMWMAEAREVLDTTKSEVIITAKSYLAFDAMRKKYHCHAVSTHMRGFTGDGRKWGEFWPGLGMIEFQKHGIQALCQEYSNIMVSHLLAYYITGRPSMLGDLIIDTFNNITILTHCGAPLNPHGNDRIPYTLKSHAESPVSGTMQPGSSTGVEVHFPVNETVTVWKVYVLHKKIGVYTGTTVRADNYYTDINKAIHCRSKLITKVDDANKILNHFETDAYGIHRAGTFGDLRSIIKDLAYLIGFEVIEEDK